MHRFDYSFLRNGLVPARLVSITAAIVSLRTADGFRRDNHRQVFTELEAIARVQSVKSSNAIEGIVTSDQRIVQIVRQDSAPLNHDEAEIAGYRDALAMVHQGYKTMDFSCSTILGLHKTLLLPSGSEFGGKYKQENNVILEIDVMGQRHVRFRPVSAQETGFAMEQLELAYQSACQDSSISPLLLIPCVVFDFLCIHPFKDGNGRMSRLLSLLLLYQHGFDVGRYISFEEQINQGKQWYYRSLAASSEGWHENNSDYFPFVENFLQNLYRCYHELDKRFAVVDSKKVSKMNRIEAVVLGSLLPVSKAEICDILPDVSPTTVELVLGRMKKTGVIETIGAGRGTRYVRKRRGQN